MKREDVVPGILVHHDQLGLGKITRRFDEENQPGVWVTFIFFTETKVALEYLEVVNGNTVNITYSVPHENSTEDKFVPDTQYEQNCDHLFKDQEEVCSCQVTPWMAPVGIVRGKISDLVPMSELLRSNKFRPLAMPSPRFPTNFVDVKKKEPWVKKEET